MAQAAPGAGIDRALLSVQESGTRRPATPAPAPARDIGYGVTRVSSAIICSMRSRSGTIGLSLIMRTRHSTGPRSG